MSVDQSPIVYRAILANELYRFRREAGLKQETVAAALDWSPSKIIRIEGGTVGVSTTDLRALLLHYKIEDGEVVERLTQWARRGRERGWWADYHRDLHDSNYLNYVGYEAGCSVLRSFQGAIIPPLLQTEQYAQVATGRSAPQASVDTLVEIRIQRQDRLLKGENPPQLIYVLDEAVIRRWVGVKVDPQIMPRQLRHLLDLAGERSSVIVKVLPFTVGAHFGQQGSFTLLEFEVDLHDVLYIEDSRGQSSIITGRDEMVTRHREGFEEMYVEALSQKNSVRLVRSVIDEMEKHELSRSDFV